MIIIENFTFKYQNAKKNALKNINLSIGQGDFLGIIGESGAGKTTLTYGINGIIPHHYSGDYYGSVSVLGEDTFETSPGGISQIVGSVLQDIDSQMVASVVEDEILYGLENYGVPRQQIGHRLEAALENVGIPHLRYRTIASLSGGQKQKVAIAAILALQPKILLMDEPTSELDPKSAVQIFQILKQLNAQHNITIIVVEQKIMLLCEYAKSLAVMRKGRIILHGTVREVLQNSELLEESGIHCPRVVTLSNRLHKLGLCDRNVCQSVDEAEYLIRSILDD